MQQLSPKCVLIRSKSQLTKKLLSVPVSMQQESKLIHYKSSTKIITNIFGENDLPRINIIQEAPPNKHRHRAKSGAHIYEFKVMTKLDKMQLGLNPRSTQKKPRSSITLNEKLKTEREREPTFISINKELLMDTKPDTITAILSRKKIYIP